MTPLLFAVVDAVLNDTRRECWALRAWPHRRRRWAEARETLRWWRSTW
jgi:hypothetical protein